MFALNPLRPNDNWQEVLKRDGLLVLGSSIQRHFLVQEATDEERVVGLVSTLDALGKLEWTEKELDNRYKSKRYTVALPGLANWSVTLMGVGEYNEDTGYRLGLDNSEGPGHSISHPQSLVEALYHRVYQRFGHNVVTISPRWGAEDFYKEKEKMVTDALAVLEEAVAR